MTNQQKYAWTGALLLFVGAQAAHWLITPIDHPDASGFRIAMVWLQLLGGVGGAAAAWWKSKRAATNQH